VSSPRGDPRSRERDRAAGTPDQYRTLFEDSSVPIIIFDQATFEIVAVNRSVVENYGYTREELLSMTIPDLVPEWEHEKFLESRARLAQEGSERRRRLWSGPWHHRRKDGSMVELEILGNDIEFDGRQCRVSFCTDVTVHNKVVAELARAREEAVEASNLKSAFLANMSHELRTPMNGVIGMTSLLLDSELNEEQRAFAEQAVRSGEQMLAIINDILDISKLEAGRVELDMTVFDLRDALADACAGARAEATAKGVAFVVEVAPELAAPLRGDCRRIQQIVTNLVSNAVKFTRSGTVAVAVAVKDMVKDRVAIELSVSDTGIGIAPEVVARMFDPFAQAEVATTRHYGGTGLGLAIVRELAELMGGGVSARSEPGVGSTFVVAIELETVSQLDAERPAAPAQPAAGPRWTAPPRVLVVEDSAVNQIVAARLIERVGCDVQVAADGRDALAALARERFSAVLMDCQMPVLDGYSATAELRERERAGSRHTPVIAMTAYAMEGDRARCLAAGMDDYISKPLERGELEAVLRRWIPSEEPE
jgi:PAS domain S-box-containing protein